MTETTGKYNHWFVSRQKRKLTDILPALFAFYDICDGKVWTPSLQLELEDALSDKGISRHGNLRARRINAGGGGTRTLFTQMKDLGLVFMEDDSRKVHLTLVGTELVSLRLTFVEGMRLQLSRYQYPSATRWKGTGSVNHNFRVHPFIFLFRLLMDSRLNKVITMDEMSQIIIHYAVNDSNQCFDDVVSKILQYRENQERDFIISDSNTDTFSNIANTFFNYMELTQYIDRGERCILVRSGKEAAIRELINETPKLLKYPECQENYQRQYGVGTATKDLRSFNTQRHSTKQELDEARIKREYAMLRLERPITGVDSEIVEIISNKTGIDDRTVEAFLTRNFPHGSLDDFFLTYREYAYHGREYAAEFELATVEVFRKIFGMTAKHVGSIGNTPDVFVESDTEQYCGIIDNKAYEKGYSISGDHERRMVYEYIPKVQQYAEAKYPLQFFSYLSTDFGVHINSQIQKIATDSGVHGSAMPVDLMIDFAQDYAEKGYTHKTVKELFSVNRRVCLEDLNAAS